MFSDYYAECICRKIGILWLGSSYISQPDLPFAVISLDSLQHFSK